MATQQAVDTHDEMPAKTPPEVPATPPANPVTETKRKRPATPENPSATKRQRASSSIASTPKGTPSSIKQARIRVHHGKRSARDEKELAPGDSNKLKSFVNLAKKEGEVGAYLRYARRDEFRTYAMSAWVLEAYIAAFTDPGRQVRQGDVLGYIRDQQEEMGSDEDPCTRYPLQEDGIHAMQRMALAICQLYRRTQKTVFDGSRYTQKAQNRLAARFKKLTNRTPPTVQVEEVVLKDLGPHTSHGEGELEAFNRCFNVIMYVSFSLNSSTWGTRFASQKWAEKTEFSSQVVPHWMRQRDGTAKSAPAPDQSSSSPDIRAIKPTRQVEVVWKHKAKTPWATDLMAHLVDEDLAYDLVLTTKIDIRATATAAEVRDLIRAKFKMGELGAQIKTLQALPSMVNIMEDEWSSVQEAIWADESSETVFQMTLRRKEEAEEVWENAEIPGLSKCILATDGEDVQPLKARDAVTEEKEHLDALVDTIHRLTGTSVDYLSQMVDKHFKDRKEDLLKFFTVDNVQYDVTTQDGLLQYQRKICTKVTHRDHLVRTEDTLSREFGKKQLTPAQLSAFNEARVDGQLATLGLPEGAGEARHYALNAIHSGTQSQVGLPINVSARALQMEKIMENGQEMYRSKLPGLSKISFYPWQVSGAATCLIGMLGYIPLPEDAPQDARDAAEALRGLAIGGKLIGDQTGMGKSILLLVTTYYARYHIVLNEDGERVYKLTVLSVPSGVIKQWADEVIRAFPELKLIISYDDAGLPDPKYKKYFISPTAMKNPDHINLWPQRFHYLFDDSDPDT
jgi:hypothetical protein